MLSAENIHYTTGNSDLVRDITFKAEANEVLVLVGANGAGKSTLLKLLAGDLKPTVGKVCLDQKTLEEYKTHQLALKRAVMQQQALINFDFTVFEVALLGRHPHIHSGETYRDYEIVEKKLEQTETDHLTDRLYATLSGGEQARVTYARVLAQETPILLLDEPTSALDLRHQQLAMQIARNLADKGGVVVAILHDLNLAAMYADRIGMMREGELVAIGTPHEVLTSENIQTVFNLPVHIMPHPHQDCPLIVPLMSQLTIQPETTS